MTDLNLELHNKLKKIKKVFNTSKIISRVSNLKTIARYYKVNKLFYTIFVSNDNFIHMGISRSGKLVKSDLLEHAKLVEKYIIKISKVTHVLELATGRGATSAYLAEKYPNNKFSWIIGNDNLADFSKWKDWQKIIKNYQLIIFPRDINQSDLESATKKHLKLVKIPSNIIVLNQDDLFLTDVNSTIVRKRVRTGKSIKYLVPDKIEKYIIDHQLYVNQ